MMKKPRFLAVDFFCGAGGTTRGFLAAGGYVSIGFDFDSSCEATYIKNNRNRTGDGAFPHFFALDLMPVSDNYPDGEQHIATRKIREFFLPVKEKWPDVPVVFSICAPCQPFTRVTRIEMTNDTMQRRLASSGLLTEMLRLIRIFQPDVVFTENVPGIRSDRYGNVWSDYEEGLTELGYLHGSETVCASKFGIPQRRRRVILIAIRKNALKDSFGEHRLAIDSGLRLPTLDARVSTVTVRQAIGHLPALKAGQTDPNIPNHQARSLSRINQNRLIASIPGSSNREFKDTEFGNLLSDCHREMDARSVAGSRRDSVGYTDVYTRMHPDRPSPTITTKCVSVSNGRFGHFDEKQVRAITPREAAILQSFPETYVFFPTDKTDPAARMIGNAVPPKLSEFFINFAVELLNH